LIRKAFDVSVEAQRTTKKIREAYIFHPIVAKIVASEIGLGATSHCIIT
jgi:hypothetical protein